MLRSSSLTDMFKNLILFLQTSQSEYSHTAFLEEFTSATVESSDCPEILAIHSSCTSYAAKLTTEQLLLSKKINYDVNAPAEGTAELIYGTHHHFVQVDKATCSCSFSKTMGLPCRHVFVVRQNLNLPMFEEFMVQKRWLASYQC